MSNVFQIGAQFGRKSRVAIWVLWGCAVVWVPLIVQFVRGFDRPGYELPVDLQVYLNGGLAWLRGLPLYHDFPGVLGGLELPFTYPPIAAVLFSTLSLAPPWVIGTVSAVASFLALTLAAVVVARVLSCNYAWTVGAGAAVCFLTLEPVIATINFGQVNLLLMALVVVDCLAGRRFRGALVGVAAAIKLTPAVFVLYFLFRRDWRSAATALAAFIGTGVLGFVFAPTESREYWSATVFDTGRPGGLNYAMNQSLRGMLHRFGLEPSLELVLWVLLSLAVVALAWRISRSVQNRLVLLLVLAVAGLLISPVSWSHHWVWVAPIVLLIGATWWATRDFRWFLALVATWWIFNVAPFQLLPRADDREMRWVLWQQLPGNLYIFTGLGFLFAVACSSAIRRHLERAFELPHAQSDRVVVPQVDSRLV